MVWTHGTDLTQLSGSKESESLAQKGLLTWQDIVSLVSRITELMGTVTCPQSAKDGPPRLG